MARPPRQRDAAAEAALARLRPICRELPATVETASFGNPAFKVKGKIFAVLDRYRESSCLWLRIDSGRRPELLALPGWFASPHDPRETAMCCDLTELDWAMAAALIRDSYRLAVQRT